MTDEQRAQLIEAANALEAAYHAARDLLGELERLPMLRSSTCFHLGSAGAQAAHAAHVLRQDLRGYDETATTQEEMP